MLGYNKLNQAADFAAIDDVIKDIYNVSGDEAQFRKYWEVAQSVRGLRDFGALHPHARLLGVGAGTERTTFYLSNFAEQVFCTDLYIEGGWPNWADRGMLLDPSPWAGGAWDRRRVVVQHMNGCELWYPDNFFDGIYSASSIEHFGTLDDVARSAREIGRVLKPGGIAAISTEFKINDHPGDGWGNVIVFNPETVQKYIVEPSGCELVEPFDFTMDQATLNAAQNLDWVVAAQSQGKDIPRPHVVLSHLGYLFCSLSIVMRKPA